MKTWLRPVPLSLVVGCMFAERRAPVDDAAPNRSVALVGALTERGIDAAPEDVVWLDGEAPGVWAAMFGRTRALVRGHARAEAADEGPPSDAHDLYVVDTRLSPEGSLLDVGDAYDLTRTSDADEGLPVVAGTRAAYVLFEDARPVAVHVLDLAGHGASAYAELSRLQRWQVALTNWQETGSTAGVARTVFHPTSTPSRLGVAFTPDGHLAITADDRTVTVDPRAREREGIPADLRASRDELAKPATFAPWMSERLRALSWFGDEKNQALKAVVFTVRAYVSDAKTKLFGDTSASEVEDDMGSLRAGTHEPATFTDPETRWPPAALAPIVHPSLAGEGQWIALDGDPFITPIPGVGSPFVTTFLRSDPSALQTRVYVTLWDPRLVALHMVAGTIEPVSATGEAGPGRIPRKPEILRHVVAGFNGGFQATHGQFGMQADDVLYLPPKPYAATVMEMRDGTTAFGAWPLGTGQGAGQGTGPRAGRTAGAVPENVVSFRQNLTALVQDGKYNPWGRTWWGGVPPGWHDAVHTTRSGLCLTKDGFVAYFWGNDIAAEPLGRAMLAAQCTFGMHLDMNPGLAGFEFYDVQPVQSFEPLGRPLQTDWEFEGTLKDVPDVRYRSRRMIKSMGHILFPRYIHRDGRDFFYLTTRDVLPGPPLPDAASAPGATAEPWRIKGLPQHGYPYAIATAAITLPNGRRARVLRVDPRVVRAIPKESSTGGATAESGALVVAFGSAARAKNTEKAGGAHATATPAGHGSLGALVLRDRAFALTDAAAAGTEFLASVRAAPASEGALEAPARAVVGLSDDGMLQWIELAPAADADPATTNAMLAVLARIGCATRALVDGDTRAWPGGAVDLGGSPAALSTVTARLGRVPGPGAQMIFDTPVVPLSVWQPLQAQRVKWRPTLAPPEKPADFTADAGASTPESGATSPP